jgi:hypothetical protein
MSDVTPLVWVGPQEVIRRRATRRVVSQHVPEPASVLLDLRMCLCAAIISATIFDLGGVCFKVSRRKI